jgi:hypothetical protein|nr:MAG TPA: capsid fiber protein [Caudoviricetes sp.]
MAQMKPFSWYQQGMAPGFPGMKANTTEDTVDSFACEGGCNPGDLVTRGTNAARQAKVVASAGDKAVGIVLHEHHELRDPYYADGETVSVMTSGDVYVLAGADVVAGDPVAYEVGTGFIKGTEKTSSGNTYMANAETGDIVRVRIRHAAAIPVTVKAAAGKVGEAVVGESKVEG